MDIDDAKAREVRGLEADARGWLADGLRAFGVTRADYDANCRRADDTRAAARCPGARARATHHEDPPEERIMSANTQWISQGEECRALRQLKGVKVNDLASMAGVAQSVAYAMMAGKADPARLLATLRQLPDPAGTPPATPIPPPVATAPPPPAPAQVRPMSEGYAKAQAARRVADTGWLRWLGADQLAALAAAVAGELPRREEAELATMERAIADMTARRNALAARIKARAFTLIEMLVVLLIVAVLAALALSVARTVHGQDNAEATRRVNALVMLARAKSVQARKPVALVIPAETMTGLNADLHREMFQRALRPAYVRQVGSEWRFVAWVPGCDWERLPGAVTVTATDRDGDAVLIALRRDPSTDAPANITMVGNGSTYDYVPALIITPGGQLAAPQDVVMHLDTPGNTTRPRYTITVNWLSSRTTVKQVVP